MMKSRWWRLMSARSSLGVLWPGSSTIHIRSVNQGSTTADTIPPQAQAQHPLQTTTTQHLNATAFAVRRPAHHLFFTTNTKSNTNSNTTTTTTYLLLKSNPHHAHSRCSRPSHCQGRSQRGIFGSDWKRCGWFSFGAGLFAFWCVALRYYHVIILHYIIIII